MIALSAADAISPALRRTREFLFRPFRLGTYLKLCLVAMITEGLGGNFHSSGLGGHGEHHGHYSGAPFTMPRGEIVGLVAVAIAVAILLGLVVFYLVTRLRFAYFHCLIHGTKEIAPGWRQYGAQAARFFWLNVMVAIGFVLAAAVVALPFVAGFRRVIPEAQAGGHVDVGSILALVLPLIPLFLLFIVAAIAADVVLRDLILPHYALENATAGEAWRAVWARFRAEKGAFILYAVVRVILPVAATIAIGAVLLLPVIVTAGTVAVVEIAIHAAFAGATGGAAAMAIFFEVLIGLVAFCLAALVGIAVSGPVSTAIREYALLFYGGRYPRLGDVLSAGTGAA